MIIDWAHLRALHGGYRLTHSHVMKRAWLLGGRARIKARLRECMICAKALARPSSQIMAPLPAARVTVTPPFSRCGVDYAGPFQVLHSKGRGLRAIEGCVAVFVCLNTKYCHHTKKKNEENENSPVKVDREEAEIQAYTHTHTHTHIHTDIFQKPCILIPNTSENNYNMFL